MARVALVVTYLAGAAAAVILLNASSGEVAIVIWAVASVLLGWGTGRPFLALLAFLAIPFSIPFGYPDNYPYREPLPIWWSAAIYSLVSAVLIVLTALIRRIVALRSSVETRRSVRS